MYLHLCYVRLYTYCQSTPFTSATSEKPGADKGELKNIFSYYLYLNNALSTNDTVLPYTTDQREYYEWPSNENMFLFTSNYCLPPPYGCNPPHD